MVSPKAFCIVADLTHSNDLIVTYTVKMFHNIYFLKFYIQESCIFKHTSCKEKNIMPVLEF